MKFPNFLFLCDAMVRQWTMDPKVLGSIPSKGKLFFRVLIDH